MSGTMSARSSLSHSSFGGSDRFVSLSPPGAIWRVVAAASCCEAVDGARPRVSQEDADLADGPTCRFCFCERDVDAGGQLVSPCACVGTQRWVHLRCLNEWQRTSVMNGSEEKAYKCDVCQTPFSIDPPDLTLCERLTAARDFFVRTAVGIVLRSWLVFAGVGAAAGGTAGLVTVSWILAKLLYTGWRHMDDRAARDAGFALAMTLLLPVLTPLVAVLIYAGVIGWVVLGAFCGGLCGVLALPILTAHVRAKIRPAARPQRDSPTVVNA